MPFNPEELGLEPEETSEPVTAADLGAIISRGQEVMAAQQQAARPRRPALSPAAIAARKAALAEAQARLQATRAQEARPEARQAIARAAAPTVAAPRSVGAIQELDARLELASVYRSLIQNPLFDENDANDFTELVEQEVRGFITDRLGELLGTKRPTPPPSPPVEVKPQFTDVEAQVLRALVQGIMAKKPEVAAAAAASTAPAEEAAPAAPVEPPKPRRARVARAPAPVAAKPPPTRRSRQAPPSPPVEDPTPAGGAEEPAEEPQEQAAPPAPQGPPPERIPMPTGAALEGVMAVRAAQESRETERLVERTRRVVKG